ncbi:MAG: tetratricopeptide repeat protein [Deferribacteres bacterium]|nr:tetratricopeptide repeat protein [candidate division KSB1 bacterium]MCB9503295.1 tetratricopeptide repeat protein [Deferribacteres bacterium]
MKICPKCQSKNEVIDNFCGTCGFKFIAFSQGMGLTQKELKAVDIKTNLGLVYFNMGKYEAALEVLEKVLETSPDNMMAMSLKNRILREIENGKRTEENVPGLSIRKPA